jgi:hypothetical protein
MYKLKIKGQKEIYFFPDSGTPPLAGSSSTSQKKGKDKN